ncbi:MAG: biotin synthase BioB [Leptospiraceae bacterium]|nr:biotin synthase BioB [Leptospiraceae bacterium]MDW8305486.1 biotin synthase BioB [Leptospiraceae bacterium]
MKKEEVLELFHKPLFSLIEEAHTVSLQNPLPVKKSKLLSIKTGGCPEDCAYCAQSVYYKTDIKRHPLLPLEVVREKAIEALAQGAQRFCLGGAYRQAPQGKDFERILSMVREVRALGLECCLTLGMLEEEQVRLLKEAGLSAYNHNLDTSAAFYSRIITTRTYEDRLRTLHLLARYDIPICCGGIIGMGESEEDHADFLWALLSLPKAPESIPLNLLVPIPNTPLGDRKVQVKEKLALLRLVCLCRILFPTSSVRIAAGRKMFSPIEQMLLFYAGANSVFIGEKLLTAVNVGNLEDRELWEILGQAMS